MPLFVMQVSGRSIRLRRPDALGLSGRAPCDRTLRNKEQALAFRNDSVGAVESEKTTIHPHSIRTGLRPTADDAKMDLLGQRPRESNGDMRLGV